MEGHYAGLWKRFLRAQERAGVVGISIERMANMLGCSRNPVIKWRHDPRPWGGVRPYRWIRDLVRAWITSVVTDTAHGPRRSSTREGIKDRVKPLPPWTPPSDKPCLLRGPGERRADCRRDETGECLGNFAMAPENERALEAHCAPKCRFYEPIPPYALFRLVNHGRAESPMVRAFEADNNDF